MIEIREYIDGRGRSPFGRWFDGLDARAANRIRTALTRMEAGNLSNTKTLAEECWSAAYMLARATGYISAGMGDTLIVLLGEGAKVLQQRDIEQARELSRVQDDASPQEM